MKITYNILKDLLRKELPNTTHLKKIKGIEYMLVRQAEKESSLEIYAERYESHIRDSSAGIYQLLKGTMRWLGFVPKSEFEYFFPEIQVEYALKYLDKLYSEFPEIHNPTERLRMAIASYNCGKANINKMLKKYRALEEIHYEAENTIQGKWATYEGAIKMAEKYGILAPHNISINKRYIKYITEGDENNV